MQFRDVTHLYSVLTMAWMYLTPIFYPIDQVPAEVVAVIRCNPLYMYITLFRSLVLYGTVPPIGDWLQGAVIAVASLAIGVVIFRKMQRKFILYI